MAFFLTLPSLSDSVRLGSTADGRRRRVEAPPLEPCRRSIRPPGSSPTGSSRPGATSHTSRTQSLVRNEGLHTVCQEAGCPNIYECWEAREATFLIGGDQCTRRCDFCQIDTLQALGPRP
jgi:hypothetical protein